MATKLYNLDYDLNISVIKPLQQDNFAKIVSPINRGDSLNILATLTLELINLSAENHNKNNHASNIITAKNIKNHV